MDQSIPSSKEMVKTENDSSDRKGRSDVETMTGSDVSSYYEINVHENFSSESNNSRASSYFCDRPKLIVKVKKVGESNECVENNQRDTHSSLENLKKIANPLIESYYPFLKDHQIGNITIEVNVNPLHSDGKDSGNGKENVDKSVDEKRGENSVDITWNKPNESATSDNLAVKEGKNLAMSSYNKTRKKLKRQILQYILMKKGSEFNDVEWKEVEEDQLHIHHHEHHHHYHMDGTKLKDESDFSFLRDEPNIPIHWSEDKENEYKSSDVISTEFGVKERERSNYLYDCSHQHPVNFLIDKNSRNLSNLTFVRRPKEESVKIADKYASRSEPIRAMKKASSLDSLSRKKSDLVIFHNYSDTEVSRSDSQEGSFTDVPSSKSTVNLGRNLKKGTKTEKKRSKPLREEREAVVENMIQENNSTCTALKKLSDKDCDEKKKTCVKTEKINKKPGNLSDLVEKLKQSEETNEVSKEEFKILAAKKMKKSVDIDESGKQARDCLTKRMSSISSECEPENVKKDKEISNENVKSTATITTSSKNIATVVKTPEDGLCKSREKRIRSTTPKSVGSSRDKMRSSTRKKIENKEEVALKTFGLSGNSKSKGVVHCYYSCSRNRECNITVKLEGNRKRPTVSLKSGESNDEKKKERTSAN